MPEGRESYDVAIIGAGQAAPPLARKLAAAGKRVALFERARMGGSCVNFGCTPTKAALASARLAHQARRADAFGIRVGAVTPDFGAVIRRARGIAEESRVHLDQSFGGLDNPRLVRADSMLAGREGEGFRIEADGTFVARQVVLDVGVHSIIPPIEGLAALAPLTAETWLDLETLPRHLAVIGDGVIAVEMAQFYRRMGSEVTIIGQGGRLLAREHPDVSHAIEGAFAEEGIGFLRDVRLTHASRAGDTIRLAHAGGAIEASHVFVAAGRAPNTEGLGLDSLGVALTDQGAARVDQHLQTSVPGLYAAGDLRGGPQFTHTAWDDHRILLASLLSEGGGEGGRTTDRVVPYAVFCDPELGRVGLDEAQAAERNIPHHALAYDFASIGKARETGATRGFIRVVAAPDDRILGATILGEQAAELIHLFVVLMQARAGLSALRDAIITHPTLSEGVQSAAG